jgi:hypothetical protein
MSLAMKQMERHAATAFWLRSRCACPALGLLATAMGSQATTAHPVIRKTASYSTLQQVFAMMAMYIPNVSAWNITLKRNSAET